MRHAFDADHIAAIDNSTRKLMADGERPLGNVESKWEAAMRHNQQPKVEAELVT